MQQRYAPWTDSQAWPAIRQRAREMRTNPTPAERALWSAVRARKLGVRFRRQHTIGSYIADFCCIKAGLAVELDGPIHGSQQAEDAIRQEFIEGREFRVLRFSNEEVLKELPRVVASIRAALSDSSS